MQVFYSEKEKIPQSLTLISRLRDDADNLLAKQNISADEVGRLIPRMQKIIRRFADTNGTQFYIFLDDLHYLPSAE